MSRSRKEIKALIDAIASDLQTDKERVLSDVEFEYGISRATLAKYMPPCLAFEQRPHVGPWGFVTYLVWVGWNNHGSDDGVGEI